MGAKAAPGHAHHREYLGDLFWPDLDYERARLALNTALWHFRRLLALDPGGDPERQLVTIGTDVVFKPDASIKIDTLSLQHGLSALLQAPDAHRDQAVNALRQPAQPFDLIDELERGAPGVEYFPVILAPPVASHATSCFLPAMMAFRRRASRRRTF
jgi:hypothetical protein